MTNTDTASSGHGDSGFSLLEALVALAIMSAALVPIFQMQTTLNQAVARIAVMSNRVSVGANVVSRLSVLNPMLEESGEEWLSGHHFIWESRQLESFTQETSELSVPRTVALFEISYTIETSEGVLIDERKVKLVGWLDASRQP